MMVQFFTAVKLGKIYQTLHVKLAENRLLHKK
jgi:hypothetical protein